MVTIKIGEKEYQIDSIAVDPYQNNAPVVALSLNVPDEAVEFLELYDKDDKRLEIVRYGSVPLGNKTTVKFLIDGKLPDEARIVVHIFEGLQKHNLPFAVKAISLAGLPMQ